MNELSEALQNLNLYPVPIEVSKDFTGYIADVEEPMEFQAPPPEKSKPKKRRRYVDWRKVRRRKPTTRKVPKIENPMDKGKGIEIEENARQVEMEIGKNTRQIEMEIGESSRQIEELPLQEELNRLLASCDIIRPINNNLFPYPAETQLPINLEPAIPDPLIHTQPLGEMDEWWTNDWQFQNLLNNPYTFSLSSTQNLYQTHQ
ncbi:hypothetical protein HanXRQr2_Chr13g0579821 [Helianthus annuus]|uniref:Uncharacterized protein n=1 Tax=Helianthus annuus TaxID=4232 RepID=A0A9K3HAZ8_HELAN|nr:hypothetical protein HanXRQr2_Chr13g0579821 [Helianthus annuus]KAJ0848481.1 hypothetical protein HanPSC8_Chr13g0557971 [Helianthus annuus]